MMLQLASRMESGLLVPEVEEQVLGAGWVQVLVVGQVPELDVVQE